MSYIQELRTLLLAVTKHNCKVTHLAAHLARPEVAEVGLTNKTGAEAVLLLLNKGMDLEASNLASAVIRRLEHHY